MKAIRTLNGQIHIYEDTLTELKSELFVKDDLICQDLACEEQISKELEDLKKNIRMMDTTYTLDKILDFERKIHIRIGLGYDGDQ